MSKVKVLNTELDIDFFDSDLVARIEKGAEKISQESQHISENTNLSEAIKRECNLVRKFLDYVFGEGTSNKVFGDKYSLSEAIEVFQIIIDEKNKQSEKFIGLKEKYSMDRVQRIN